MSKKRHNKSMKDPKIVNKPVAYLESDEEWVGGFRSITRQNSSGQQNDILPSLNRNYNANLSSRQNGSYPPFYLSEWDLTFQRDAARYLEAYSTTFINVLDNLTNFTIGSDGFDPTVSPLDLPNRGYVSRTKLSDFCNTLLQSFISLNQWGQLESELFKRSRRDGEAFLRFTDEGFGDVLVSTVEPEQITEPTDQSVLSLFDGSSQSNPKYGILQDNFSQFVYGYYVASQYTNDRTYWEFLEPPELFHIKTEFPDRCAKRGVSDAFSCANELDQVRKFIKNLGIGGTIQSAIAFIRESAPTDIPTLISEKQEHFPPGRIITTKAGQKYIAGPLGGTDKSSLVSVLQDACLASIGSRWQFPVQMLSGNYGTANFSAILSSEGPLVKSIERKQFWYKSIYIQILMRVLEIAADAGRLKSFGIYSGESLKSQIDITLECPNVATRNKKEDAEINVLLFDKGAMSLDTLRSKQGLDPDKEEALIQEEQKRAQEQQALLSPMSNSVDAAGNPIPNADTSNQLSSGDGNQASSNPSINDPAVDEDAAFAQQEMRKMGYKPTSSN